jgi:MFS transporter, FSR family, fosmidomycin resistance protein
VRGRKSLCTATLARRSTKAAILRECVEGAETAPLRDLILATVSEVPMRPLLNRFLLALAAGHFVIDVNANLLPIMLPFLRHSLGLSYTETALIATSYSMTSSLAQPLFGYLADRVGGRRLLVLPIIWMVVFMGVAGNARTYVTLIALVTLAGLGAAAYHPQGASNARRFGGRNAATAVSVFSLAGIAGFSLGPMLAAGAFGVFGLQGTMVFIPFGLAIAGGITVALRGIPVPPSRHLSAAGSAAARIPYLTLAALLAVVISRAWVEASVVAYTPLRFSQDVAYSSRVLFVYLFGEALGTFLGAVAADRFGRRRVIVLTCLLLAPATYFFNAAPGGFALFVPAGIAGLLLGSSVPVTIVMAQELLPRNVGVASGLMMGFAFGMGGLGVTINGLIADAHGLGTSLMVLAALPLIAGIVAATLPASLEARDLPPEASPMPARQ